MSDNRRIPLAEARLLAEELAALLEPAVERIEIAGSIRRQRETVGDIEILAVPKTERSLDLWGHPIADLHSNALDDLCGCLLARGLLSTREANGKGAWGERYKRASYRGMSVDLFSCIEPAQFGVIYLIRTGPAEFSRRLVTDRRHGGMMPSWLRVREGAIRDRRDGRVIETPNEADVFEVLGLAYVEPHDRH